MRQQRPAGNSSQCLPSTLASKDGLAPNKLTGPTELGVAARGSSGNAEEEGFPAGVNLSLHSAPTSAHLARGLFLRQQQE